MADSKQLRRLIGYNQWADERSPSRARHISGQSGEPPAHPEHAARLARAVARRGTGHSIVQMVNHGTAHRAETGLLLDRLGRSPGDLDYSYYCFDHP